MTVPNDLKPPYMQLAEQRENWYIHKVGAGTDLNQVASPQYWGHVSAKLAKGDRIWVVCDDDPTIDLLIDVLGVEKSPHAEPVLRLAVTPSLACDPSLRLEPLAPEIVQYRTDFVPGANWRAVGPDHRVLAQGLKTEDELHAAMAAVNQKRRPTVVRPRGSRGFRAPAQNVAEVRS